VEYRRKWLELSAVNPVLGNAVSLEKHAFR
jgi:hypothetical protein